MFAFLKKRRIRPLVIAIALLLLVGSVFLYWNSRGSLADFVDQDLSNLDDTHKTVFGKLLGHILPEQFPGPRTTLNQILGRFLPDEFKNRPEFWLEPWYIWRCKTKTGRGFMLFQARPGRSLATVHFLALNGKYHGTSEFSTRWPIEEAALVDQGLLGPVIKVKNTGGIGYQTYGSHDNRIALLRIEDHVGKLVENNYWYQPIKWGLHPQNTPKKNGRKC
jgi:hypothetical protein